MKKYLLLAASLILFATACEKENSIATEGELVEITVNIPHSDLTRAGEGSGAEVDRCILQVYRNDKPYGEQLISPVVDYKATFSTRLVATQLYDFVFWADCSDGTEALGDNRYVTADLENIYVKGDYEGNNEQFDAFTYSLRDYKVNGSFGETIILKRPFGQLNISTQDIEQIYHADLIPSEIEIAFSALPAGYNARSTMISNEDVTDIVYRAPIIDLATGQLSVDYIWAPVNEAVLADFKVTFINDDDVEITTNENFTNIGIRRNYQTMVTGNLLTKERGFIVEINPIFLGPELGHEVAE